MQALRNNYRQKFACLKAAIEIQEKSVTYVPEQC